MKRLLSEISAPFLILAAAAALFHHSRQLPPPRFEPMGPAFFPQLVLKGIIVLASYTIIKALYIYWKTGRREQSSSEAFKTVQSGRGNLLPAVTVALFAGYILLIVFTDLHFLLLSFLFICVLCCVLNGSVRSCWLPAVLSAAGVVAAMYLVFGLLLGTFFP